MEATHVFVFPPLVLADVVEGNVQARLKAHGCCMIDVESNEQGLDKTRPIRQYE